MRIKPHGFTLIELLVVISIIALLVGILLPALGAARKSAQLMQCASRARQIMMAETLYAMDHRDQMVPIIPAERIYWYNSLREYVLKRVSKSGSDNPSPSEIFVCPSDPFEGGKLSLGAGPPNGVIGVPDDAYLLRSYDGSRFIHGKRIGDFPDLSHTMAFVDHQWWLINTRVVAPERMNVVPEDRHPNNVVQLVYLDVHVAPMEHDELSNEADLFLAGEKGTVWGPQP